MAEGGRNERDFPKGGRVMSLIIMRERWRLTSPFTCARVLVVSSRFASLTPSLSLLLSLPLPHSHHLVNIPVPNHPLTFIFSSCINSAAHHAQSGTKKVVAPQGFLMQEIGILATTNHEKEDFRTTFQ